MVVLEASLPIPHIFWTMTIAKSSILLAAIRAITNMSSPLSSTVMAMEISKAVVIENTKKARTILG